MGEALSRDEFLAAMEARFEGKRHSDYPMVKSICDASATREQIGYLA